MKAIARGEMYTFARCDGKLSSVTLFIRAIVVCLRSIADYVVYEILMTVRKLCVVDGSNGNEEKTHSRTNEENDKND